MSHSIHKSNSDSKTLSYTGAVFGAFAAGTFSDAYGRIKGIYVACLLCFYGVVLQASAQNLAHMLCARIIAGVGVSFIIVIVPAWTAGLAPAAHRGKMIALTFLANFSGISLSAWIGFGPSFTEYAGGAFRWRFCFSTQIIPVIFLNFGAMAIPESPRWLVKAGRDDEGFEIITLLRGNGDPQHPDAQKEYQEIVAVVLMEQENQSTNYVKMLFGVGSFEIHLGRRIQLAFWLQVLMQFGTGIAAVVVYSGTIFRTAGFGDLKSTWLSALNMMVGILGTVIAAFTIDRLGRRHTIYWGSCVLNVILFIIGGLYVEHSTTRSSEPSTARQQQLWYSYMSWFLVLLG